jgi:hypothetical protein
MERVGTLINKLKEQFEQHASADKLAVTAQLLLVELQKNRSQSSIGSKVSVVLPSVSGALFNEQAEQNATRKPAPKQEESANSWLFETSTEIPTLAHQDTYKETVPAPKEIFEFNKTLANEVESLNEKLKEDRIEVVSTLQGTPVRDLKKAIGVNDRYLFVHDLFRGDENMYERSIKTINGFSIYPEAQYWIQRELKVKLSWPDNSETVKLFDQLIKRRFS